MRPIIWKLLALFFILLAVVGLLLPVVPTVPFLLLAAAAAARGWPWLDDRLVAHATYGPPIRKWREHRAIPRSGKWFAILSMAGSSVLLWFAPLPLWVRAATPVAMAAVGCWIWTRPED